MFRPIDPTWKVLSAHKTGFLFYFALWINTDRNVFL